MKRIQGRLIALILMTCTAAVFAVATDYTYRGTVKSLEGSRLTVSVVEPGTKESRAVEFTLTKATKISRDNTPVTLSAARIRTGEPITVTVNGNDDSSEALAVKLGTSK